MLSLRWTEFLLNSELMQIFPFCSRCYHRAVCFCGIVGNTMCHLSFMNPPVVKIRDLVCYKCLVKVWPYGKVHVTFFCVLFFFFLKIFILCIWVNCSCLQTHRRRPLDPIVDGCEPPCGGWELNSGPLEEQSVVLTSEPSIQLPAHVNFEEHKK